MADELVHEGYPYTEVRNGQTYEWHAPGRATIRDPDGYVAGGIYCPYIPLIPGFTVPQDWTGPDHIDTTKETIAQFEQRVAFDEAQKVVKE